LQPSFLRLKIYNYGTYLSTIEEEEKKQARIPRENGLGEWPPGIGVAQEERQKETDRF
jgi:hypothetical protein